MMKLLMFPAVTTLSLFATAAIAQPRGLEGHYVGVSGQPMDVVRQLLDADSYNPLSGLLESISPGQRSHGASEENATTVDTRYDLPNLPISVRSALSIGGEVRAIEPTLSWDVPIAERTNVYVGGGYTLTDNPGVVTPLGDRNSPVVTAGVETGLVGDAIVYGTAKWRLNRDRDASAINLQMGAGYRF